VSNQAAIIGMLSKNVGWRQNLSTRFPFLIVCLLFLVFIKLYVRLREHALTSRWRRWVKF